LRLEGHLQLSPVIAVILVVMVAAALTAVAALAVVGSSVIESDVQPVTHRDRRHDAQERRETQPRQQQQAPCSIVDEPARWSAA
jgi:hypothetical protein